MFHKWLGWLFEVTIEVDGSLNLLSSDTIRFENSVFYKNVKPEIIIKETEKLVKPLMG